MKKGSVFLRAGIASGTLGAVMTLASVGEDFGVQASVTDVSQVVRMFEIVFAVGMVLLVCSVILFILAIKSYK